VIREGRHFKTTEAKRHTLGDAIDRYQETRLIATDKARHLAWWRERIGVYTLADVNASLISQCRDVLATGEYKRRGQRTAVQRAPATANRYLATLSHVLSIAWREWEWIEANPCTKVKKLKEPRGRVRFLSDDEREQLLAACRESKSLDLYPAVVLALSTGARSGELLSIRWKDVDLQRGIITLHETKNGERRSLPLRGHALNLMLERAKVRRIDTDLVFPSNVDPLRPINLRQPWETALQRAEIDDFHWHDLRHSCASYLAMNGATLAEIAEVLGHKTLQMVKRYAHLSEAHTAKVVSKMNERIFEGM
jgi:integrase